jgi:hypothetical protein
MGKSSGAADDKKKKKDASAKRAKGSSEDASKRGKGSSEDASKRGKAKAAEKCDCCKQLSTEKMWFKTVELSNNAHGPVGSACRDCGSVHRTGFDWLPWPEFCERYKATEGFKDVVLGAIRALHGDAQFPPQQVKRKIGSFLEVRQPAIVLTERQLCKALCTSKLPKHMKSIPQLRVPRVASCTADIDGDMVEEEVFAFKDPSRPYRCVDMVTVLGFEHTKDQMERQVWEQQGQALVQGRMHAESVRSNACALEAGSKMKLKLLEDFLAVHVKKKKKSTRAKKSQVETAQQEEQADVSEADAETSETSQESKGGSGAGESSSSASEASDEEQA